MGPKPRQPLTHFLCIPLVTASSRPHLARTVAAFREDITSPNSFAVPAGAVRPVGTLHLTLGVMSLADEAKLAHAREVLGRLRLRDMLEEVRQKQRERVEGALGKGKGKGKEVGGGEGGGGESHPGVVKMALRGLHSMQKPAQATVLYTAPSDAEGLLQPFCEAVKEVFRQEGLVAEDGRALLLHATILNTIYVKGRRNNSRKRGHHGKLTIDAEPILERYDDYIWAEDVGLEKVAICKMGARPIEGGEEGDEEYEVVAEVLA